MCRCGSITEMYGYFLVALCLVGITGNALTLVVLRRKSDKKKSTNWLLRALAVVDSLYLSTRLLNVLFQFFACNKVAWLPQAVSARSAAVVPYMASSALLVHMVSVWTVVVVTVDRYITVSLPSEVELRTVRLAKLAVASVAAASVVCCLPLFVDWKTGSTLSPLECDDVVSMANPTAVPADRFSLLIAYEIACNCVLRTVIPFVILMLLSCRTLVRLRRMTSHFRKTTKKVGSNVNWRKRLTATLVAVLALFTSCQLPQLTLRVSGILRQLRPVIRLNDEVLQQASNVASGLLVVNSTANFFVYCVVGTGFRRGLFQLLSASGVQRCIERKRKVEREGIQKATITAFHPSIHPSSQSQVSLQ